eukprot:5712772-Pleurochrysis_carterae.AAC.1
MPQPASCSSRSATDESTPPERRTATSSDARGQRDAADAVAHDEGGAEAIADDDDAADDGGDDDAADDG